MTAPYQRAEYGAVTEGVTKSTRWPSWYLEEADHLADGISVIDSGQVIAAGSRQRWSTVTCRDRAGMPVLANRW